MMKILVTGGSGFIGSHVVDKLVDAGHEVSVIDVKPPHLDSVTFFEGSILSLEDIENAAKSTEVIYHIAAFSNVDKVRDDPLLAVKLNIVGTANVLEVARKFRIKRVIFASSVFVYENKGHIYTTGKKASESLCKDYFALFGAPSYTILRYGTVYGPRSRDADVISVFLRNAIAHKPLVVKGGGEQTRNFIYVEDLALGNVAALSPAAENKAYDLIGSESISIKSLACKVADVVGNVDVEIEDGGRLEDYKGELGSLGPAEKDLDWKPGTSIEEGIKKTLNHFRDTGDLGDSISDS